MEESKEAFKFPIVRFLSVLLVLSVAFYAGGAETSPLARAAGSGKAATPAPAPTSWSVAVRVVCEGLATAAALWAVTFALSFGILGTV